MINGTVLRFLSRNIVVDLGRGSEAIMPVREQVRREHWAVADRIRALILKVERSQRGPEIILTRSHPDFVKRLFEQEVPEIYEKTVEVVSVVREAGFRSKVVVRSNNPKVDPVGACVGVKGSRVRPIINELQGERIDLVAYTLDTDVYWERHVPGETAHGSNHQSCGKAGGSVGGGRSVVFGHRESRPKRAPGEQIDRLEFGCSIRGPKT
jgi:N utilization substance protein A